MTFLKIPLQSLQDVVASLRPGMTVYLPGVSGESLPLIEALKAQPQAAAGVRFLGAHFPGINRFDYLGLHPQARQRAYFMQPWLRPALLDGRAELLPLDYPGIFRDLAEEVEIDLAFSQVTPPDDAGNCSLGIAADFTPAVWNKARRRVALINPQLPRTQGSYVIRASDCDVMADAEGELLSYDGGTPNAAMKAHAALVASLVRDGDTLEFGIGKMPGAILDALSAHRNLKVYSGMVSPSVLPLIDSGVIDGKAAVQAGVALGDADFYARTGRDERFYFRPVNETHSVLRIAAIPSFCAINSGVEVDLFGQVNADSVKGKIVAGVGGLPAFVAGSRLSPGGRSIIVLPAATDDGGFSRIVATLGSNAAAGVTRHEADYVVTEHGIAALRGASLHERAKRLIAIAAPQFREGLEQSWGEIAKRL